MSTAIGTRGRQIFQGVKRLIALDTDQTDGLPLGACRQLVVKTASHIDANVTLRIGDSGNQFVIYPGDSFDFRDLLHEIGESAATGLFLTWTGQPGRTVEIWELSHSIYVRNPLS